jgi:hypothetical protein
MVSCWGHPAGAPAFSMNIWIKGYGALQLFGVFRGGFPPHPPARVQRAQDNKMKSMNDLF